jgi:hypothetical protein
MDPHVHGDRDVGLVWDASTGGNPLVVGLLTTPQSEQSGYTFTLNVLTVSLAASLAS